MASFRVSPLLLLSLMGLSSICAIAAPIHSSPFIASEITNIPDLALDPGSYTIQEVGHLADRFVVEVDAPKAAIHYTFLALPNTTIARPAKPGLVVWEHPADGKRYVRGWYYAGAPAVLEFVYPKAEAVAIAKTNEEKVPAIDPASEGRPVDIKGLSKTDLDVVTLWLLSSTRVGAQDGAGTIQAQRYKQVASAERKPVIGRLPQTASYLPWLGLVGLFSLAGAIGLRAIRPGHMRAG